MKREMSIQDNDNFSSPLGAGGTIVGIGE
ncbi:MAG: hypothetical protein RIS29_1186, partial [Bacteroidota bacterium]